MKSNDSSKIPADVLTALANKSHETEAKQSELGTKQGRLLTKLRSPTAHAPSTRSSTSAELREKASAPAQPETGFEPLLQRTASRADRFTPEEKKMAEALGFSVGVSTPPQSNGTK